MTIETIMTKRLVSIEPDDQLSLVKYLFEKTGFHHLLVVEDEQLLGIISDRDLLRHISPNIGALTETARDRATLNIRAHQVMTRKPITLGPQNSVYDAVHLFNTKNISCIPVVAARLQPIGIVTWRDIMQVIEQRHNDNPLT